MYRCQAGKRKGVRAQPSFNEGSWHLKINFLSLLVCDVDRDEAWPGGGMQGWRAGRLGYLDEETWGYALAYFPRLREETKPAWAQFLEGDVKHYFKAGMKFLRS